MILTQHPIEIALSVPAMKFIVEETRRRLTVPVPVSGWEGEVENFINLLQNLIERQSDNFDLI
jgi:hypothetical protein